MTEHLPHFSSPKKFLFKEGLEELHLHVLHTDLGKKAIYDSVCQCNRCNYCSRACPTNLRYGLESLSARGRNQAVRLIMEDKISPAKNIKQLSEIMNTCLLCGACVRECFGKILTPEHVLETERAYAQRKLPLTLRSLIKIFFSSPALFRLLIAFFNIFRMSGLFFICRLLGGFKNIKMYLPAFFIKPLPRKTTADKTDFIFLPSFEAAVTDGALGLKCLEILKKKGSVKPLFLPAGIYEYIYGTLPRAREQAAKLMEACAGARGVTDSLEIYAFVQSYPQLFEGTEEQAQAEKFIKNFFYIADFITMKVNTEGQKAALSKTNLLNSEDPLFTNTEALLKKTFKENFVAVWRGQSYPVPSAGYPFANKNTKFYFKEKLKLADESGANILVLASASQKLPLYFWAKKYYPNLKIMHIAELAE